MEEPRKTKEAFQIIGQMQSDGVIGKYAIGGAIAALFYLQPFATQDMDVFLVLPKPAGSEIYSLSEIYEYLEKHGSKPEGLWITIAGWPVQFIPPSSPLDQEAIDQAVQADFEGEKVWIMTAEHLTAISIETGRPKDIDRALRFVQQADLDQEKLRSILTRHGLMKKWNKFEREHLSRELRAPNQFRQRVAYRRKMAKASPESKMQIIEELREVGARARRSRRES
ncbi:MAG TPA: hypothetical protein VFQ00_08415 [Terriglobales bacterium]|nr:hypothetical protein [Terriglobales bacterium]